jgi:FkbM family methyltransferase
VSVGTRKFFARLAWSLDSVGRYPRFCWRLIGRPARVRLHGVWLEVPAEASAAHRREVYAERYERGEARCVLLGLEPDDVVMEIGAGVGLVSTLCARLVGSSRVTCYEANPELLPRIRGTFAANGVAPALVNAVLAREAGEAELFVEREFVASSLRVRSAAARAVRVPQLAVNEELRKVRPSCLVIDIEGGESELLPAIDWAGVRKLVIEMHPHVIGAERVGELIALLAAQGFRGDGSLSSTRKKFFARTTA